MKAWGSKKIIRREELEAGIERYTMGSFSGNSIQSAGGRLKQPPAPAAPPPPPTPTVELPAEPVPVEPPRDYAAEHAARIQAELQDAQQSGYQAGMTQGTAAGYAAGEAAGREAGEAAGHAKGYAEGLAEARKQAAGEAVRIKSAMDMLATQIAEFESRMAGPILDIAIEVARQVVRKTLSSEPDRIITVIREALDVLPDLHNQPRVQLHPDDLELVQTLLAADAASGGWRFEPDSHIERGGCRLITGSVEADLTVSTRWRRVIETLGRHDELTQVAEAPVPARRLLDEPAADGDDEDA